MWFGTSRQAPAFALMGAPTAASISSPSVLLPGASSHHHAHPVESATRLPLSGRTWVEGARVATGKQLAVCPGSDVLRCSCHIFRGHTTFVCTFDPLQNPQVCPCPFISCWDPDLIDSAMVRVAQDHLR